MVVTRNWNDDCEHYRESNRNKREGERWSEKHSIHNTIHIKRSVAGSLGIYVLSAVQLIYLCTNKKRTHRKKL